MKFSNSDGKGPILGFIIEVFAKVFDFQLTPLRGRAAAGWAIFWFTTACLITAILWKPVMYLVPFFPLFAAITITAARSGPWYGMACVLLGVSGFWLVGAIPSSEIFIRGLSLIINSALVIWLGARLRKGRADSDADRAGISEAVPDFIWSCDELGQLTYANQRCLDFHRTTPEEVRINGWQKLVAESDIPLLAQVFADATQEARAFEVEARSVAHDGEVRWFLHRGVPIKKSNGEILRWIGTSTDIHQRKLVEMEREKLLLAERLARSQAEAAGRIKDEFLGTLSHELRTPLTAIVGWVHIFQNETVSTDDFKEGVSVIDRNCRAQIHLIEDLLDMSRIITGKIRLDVQLVDLPPVVRAAMESVQPSADARGVELVSVIDTENTTVRGDPGRIQQIVWNLLSNAVKFTPRGGRVEILVHRVRSNIEISVSDTGIGISNEFLPYIFERFRQADSSTTREYEGLGLGLSIVKQLVELQGGSVTARSEGKGKGSNFLVSFPMPAVLLKEVTYATNPPQNGAVDGTHAPRATELQGIRVLVVDDEPDSRDVVRRILSRSGATVAMASSAAEALDELQHTRYHTIISDIGMPEMDGYELIRKIRALTPDQGSQTPAIALTAFAHADDRRRAIQAGYDVFVSKPVDPAELTVVVDRCASRANLDREIVT
ncbi:MAG: ATP-binding protein [Chthoniobacteraceae bacterium]